MAGFGPLEATDLFSLLDSAAPSLTSIRYHFASHPAPKERRHNLATWAKTQGSTARTIGTKGLGLEHAEWAVSRRGALGTGVGAAVGLSAASDALAWAAKSGAGPGAARRLRVLWRILALARSGAAVVGAGAAMVAFAAESPWSSSSLNVRRRQHANLPACAARAPLRRFLLLHG